METHWITPTLFVGRKPEHIARAVEVDEPEEAIEAINEGHTAVLPHHDWDGAHQTLVGLGLHPDEAEDRINSA